MQHDSPIDPHDVLKNARAILLVDWPNPQLPRILLGAGFKVFCHSPHGYTRAEIVAEYPHDVDQKNVFPPKNQEGFLVFRPLTTPPSTIDIANIYRPEKEHSRIIHDVLLPLGTKCIWLQPPVTSAKTRDLAAKHKLIFVEGLEIAQVAQRT